MKGILMIGAALVVAAAGGAGEIVASFKSPLANVRGIETAGGYLHLASGRNVYMVTEIGQLVYRVYVVIPTTLNDVSYDGRWYWGSTPTGYVYRFDGAGSIVASWPGPGPGAGIDFNVSTQRIWYATGTRIYRLMITGPVLNSFACPGVTALGGLSYDSGHVWTVDAGKVGGPIYRYTTAGSLVQKIPQPGKLIYGVTSWPGGYLWYTNRLDNWAYKITVNPSALAPASLGRVKALYR